MCLAQATPGFFWGSYSAFHFNLATEACEEIYVTRGKGCAPFFSLDACVQRCERAKKPKPKPATIEPEDDSV